MIFDTTQIMLRNAENGSVIAFRPGDLVNFVQSNDIRGGHAAITLNNPHDGVSTSYVVVERPHEIIEILHGQPSAFMWDTALQTIMAELGETLRAQAERDIDAARAELQTFQAKCAIGIQRLQYERQRALAGLERSRQVSKSTPFYEIATHFNLWRERRKLAVALSVADGDLQSYDELPDSGEITARIIKEIHEAVTARLQPEALRRQAEFIYSAKLDADARGGRSIEQRAPVFKVAEDFAMAAADPGRETKPRKIFEPDWEASQKKLSLADPVMRSTYEPY